MPMRLVPLAKLNLVYSESQRSRRGHSVASVRIGLWIFAVVVCGVLLFGVPAFFGWKHVISSSGGRYFLHRVVLPVPAFSQNDPRWTYELLGPTYQTVGQTGCAITSAAMVLASYGVDTDPHRLNQFLTTHDGYTINGWLFWEKAADAAPFGQVEKAYEDLPSYALIDKNLLAGNPVIIRLTLQNGTTHFVVIVGKQGWDYLVQDPARPASWGVYPLKELTDKIEALRFFRVVAPHEVPPETVPVTPVTPAPLGPSSVPAVSPPSAEMPAAPATSGTLAPAIPAGNSHP
jgi:hypothetical protein